MKGVLLALALLGASAAALPKLGEGLPAHPWPDAPSELVVVYSHDCGDLGPLWQGVLASGLPLRLVNAEDVPAPAPPGLTAWRGPAATAFSRALKVRAYPTILLIRGGKILNLWEGTLDLAALRALL